MESIAVRKSYIYGTDEQQYKSGFAQALQRVADVEVFTREDGAWGQNDPALALSGLMLCVCGLPV